VVLDQPEDRWLTPADASALLEQLGARRASDQTIIRWIKTKKLAESDVQTIDAGTRTRYTVRASAVLAYAQHNLDIDEEVNALRSELRESLLALDHVTAQRDALRAQIAKLRAAGKHQLLALQQFYGEDRAVRDPRNDPDDQ
jgi:hypothetical protein